MSGWKDGKKQVKLKSWEPGERKVRNKSKSVKPGLVKRTEIPKVPLCKVST